MTRACALANLAAYFRLQAIVERYTAWAGSLAERGLLAGGQKLAADGGKHVRRVDEAVTAVDGPYAEAKEVLLQSLELDPEKRGYPKTKAEREKLIGTMRMRMTLSCSSRVWRSSCASPSFKRSTRLI